MLYLSVQIRTAGLDWENTPKEFQMFKDFADVAKYSYRLALQTGKEVRVENKGNGHYYNPTNAEEYLKALQQK